jgi:hypothetical protein
MKSFFRCECWAVLLAIGWLTLAASAQTTKPAGDSLAKNGMFQTGSDGWKVQVTDEKPVAFPELLGVEKGEPSEGGNAVRVSLTSLASKKLATHATGAVCSLQRTIAKDAKLLIRFEARTAGGSPNLLVGRLWGGGQVDKVVELTSKWEPYQVELLCKFATADVIFSLIDDPAITAPIQQVAQGEFLLRDVRVMLAPDAATP